MSSNDSTNNESNQKAGGAAKRSSAKAASSRRTSSSAFKSRDSKGPSEQTRTRSAGAHAAGNRQASGSMRAVGSTGRQRAVSNPSGSMRAVGSTGRQRAVSNPSGSMRAVSNTGRNKAVKDSRSSGRFPHATQSQSGNVSSDSRSLSGRLQLPDEVKELTGKINLPEAAKSLTGKIQNTTETIAESGVGERAKTMLGSGLRAILANRIASIVAIVVLVLVVAGAADSIANMGKAYGNVTINGIEVGGMNADQITQTLKDTLGPRVSHSQVKVYATEKAQEIAAANYGEEDRLAHLEQVALAEQISLEQAVANASSWTTDALTLKAEVPYEQLANEALSYGREEGGPFARLGLFFGKHDVPVLVSFDDAAVDALAAEVDRTIGDARIDATVKIEEGNASPVAGHDGMMVDRAWFARQISSALLSESSTPSFVAKVTEAPSRITYEQAQTTSDCINKALRVGGVFNYNGNEWIAYGYEIGMWTHVETVATNGGYELGVTLDDAIAIPAVMRGAGAIVKSDNITVKFVKGDEGIVVRTFGPGNIPQVAPAVDQLEEALYGSNGIAFGPSTINEPPRITIEESDAPAALRLDQAIELGIVTVIGEYTTEFSDYEGTENRNHNIKLAADMLNNGIIEAGGGKWDFNERTGDTNEAAGFWAAGSIVEGEYVDSIGGGICQVATTIFNAVYESGLPVNTRFNHTLYIASYPTGRDAAVSYPDLSLVWTNDLTSDVLLSMSYTDTSITARLYSVHTGYTVESELGQWQEGAKYQTVFQEDDSLDKGDYYVKTAGVDGSTISVTRFVRNEAGALVSDQTFESRYDAKNEVIVIGPGTSTKGLERDDGAGEHGEHADRGDSGDQPAAEGAPPEGSNDEEE